jgi:hypothetical protein
MVDPPPPKLQAQVVLVPSLTYHGPMKEPNVAPPPNPVPGGVFGLFGSKSAGSLLTTESAKLLKSTTPAFTNSTNTAVFFSASVNGPAISTSPSYKPAQLTIKRERANCQSAWLEFRERQSSRRLAFGDVACNSLPGSRPAALPSPGDIPIVNLRYYAACWKHTT